MTVSIVKDWEGSMMRQTPGSKGVWDGVTFTHGNSIWADVVVILNSPPSNLFGFYRRGGKWLMSQEPPHESYRWQTKSYKSFDKIFTFWDKSDFPTHCIINTQTCLPWHVNKSYDELSALHSSELQKKDEVSWVTSNLNIRPGHEIRLKFIEFLNSQGFRFHLFGRGFEPILDKFDGIAPYKYSIAIENFSCNDYWTEKIADCFLSWTMPVYFGCMNITKYFPEQSILSVNPYEPKQSLDKIRSSIENNLWEQNLPYIAEARNLILNKYQFFPAITEKIRTYKIANASRGISFVKKP